MPAEKPILIHYEGSWRRYRASRSLLELTTIGDVIPVLPEPLADEPAVEFLHAREDAPADLLCVPSPTDALWKSVDTIVGSGRDTIEYQDPLE